MTKIQELEKLLKEDVLPEIEENVDELMDIVEDTKLYVDEVILYIENNNLKDEDAIEILEVLEEMRLDK